MSKELRDSYDLIDKTLVSEFKRDPEYIQNILHANREQIMRALDDVAGEILEQEGIISNTIGLTDAESRKLEIAQDYLRSNYQD